MIEFIKSAILGDINSDFIEELQEDVFNESKALKLIKSGNTNIHAVDEYGKTLLFELVRKRKIEAIKFLVSHGININAEDNYGKTVLDEAIDTHNGYMIRFLIDQGADINYVNKSNRTIMQNLALEGNLKAFRILMIRQPNLRHKDSYLKNVLFDAIEGENLEIIKDIIHEFNEDELNSVDIDGKSALFYAVLKEDLTIAKWLIMYGADVNILDNNNQNVLFNTASLGSCNLETLELLAKKGINLEQEDKEGNRVLDKILMIIKNAKNPFGNITIKNKKDKKCNFLKFTATLFEYGVSINRLNKSGTTTLSRLIEQKDYKTIEFLIIAGANINIINEQGQTVLFSLILNGLNSLATIKFLISKGIDLEHSDYKDRTIIDDLVEIILVHENDKKTDDKRFYGLKSTNNYFELLRELLILRRKNNEAKESQDKIIFEIIKYRNNKLLKLFLNNGTDLNIRNNENQTPIFSLIEDGLLLKKKKDKEIFLDNLSMLINYKIDINATNNIGQTVLHKAVIAEDFDVVEKLIFSKKTNLMIKDTQGRTPFYYTYENSDVKIARLLITNGADINETDNSGYSILNYATIYANSQLVQLLIYFGVLMYNPNKKNQMTTKIFLDNIGNLKRLLNDDAIDVNIKRAMQEVVENLKKEINQYK